MRKITAVTTGFLASGAAHAHELTPGVSGTHWTFDPWIVVPLIAFGFLYAVGALVLLHRRARASGAWLWQVVACTAGWLSLIAALVAPLHWLGERLLSFHMIEHEILMAVSAPLLVIARPVGTLLWALPRRVRFSIGRWMRLPATDAVWGFFSAGRTATILRRYWKPT